MHSITNWKQAPRPNYDTNTDQEFPYSEVPYLGEYQLVKIPLSLNELIDHVDYWGEGKINTTNGISGFSNCYNVNHPYQLVSKGPDRDRKIPNRIPVLSYTNCDTSSYIKDNSVLMVTLMGAPINSSCANDIARMVNNDYGKVVVYGFDSDSEDIAYLNESLGNKGLFYCPNYSIPNKLQSATLYGSYRAYINVTEIKTIIYDKLLNGSYDSAVELTKSLSMSNEYLSVIGDIVIKVINNNNKNIMPYAYKLWHNGGKDIVKEHFPTQFKLIFNEDNVTINNKGYNLPLKLDANTDSDKDRLAWGDSIIKDKTSKRLCWNIIPVWENNNVTFKFYNVDCNMYLKIEWNADNIGDRRAYGSTSSNEARHKYYLQPMFKNNELVFFIVNVHFKQALKLAVSVDHYGDRVLWSHNGNDYHNEPRFQWIFKVW